MIGKVEVGLVIVLRWHGYSVDKHSSEVGFIVVPRWKT